MKILSSEVSRRAFLKNNSLLLAALSMPTVLLSRNSWGAATWPEIIPSKPIKIGVIYSQTGFMGLVEKEQYKVAMMAIDEINNAGGIHGAKLQAIVRDPGSKWSNYAKYAQELLDQNVNIFWACYTSASREAILPNIQKGGAVLFYPTYYEGRECTSNMIMTGSCPNQQVDNSIPWIINKAGPKTYFVGSNYIYPRTMNKAAKLVLKRSGGQLLGEKYINLDVSDEAGFAEVIADIKAKKPDWVFSNVVGGSSIAFMRAYKKAGLTKNNMPILSCPLTEPEVAATGIEYCEGHYTSFTYFQSLDRPDNHSFIKRYQAYVSTKPEWANEPALTSGVMEASYIGMLACKQAMMKANSAHPMAIVEACRGMVIKAPEEEVTIDPDNLHTWLRPRIGMVNKKGLFDIVDENLSLVRPEVFSEEMDKGKECKDGGIEYRNGRKVPPRKVKRKIVAQ